MYALFAFFSGLVCGLVIAYALGRYQKKRERAAAVELDTTDWPDRIAVYAFAIAGFEALSAKDRRTCLDVADWCRREVATILQKSGRLA